MMLLKNHIQKNPLLENTINIIQNKDIILVLFVIQNCLMQLQNLIQVVVGLHFLKV